MRKKDFSLKNNENCCPQLKISKLIKELEMYATIRSLTKTSFVANQLMPTPRCVCYKNLKKEIVLSHFQYFGQY